MRWTWIVGLALLTQPADAAIYDCKVQDSAHWDGPELRKSPIHEVMKASTLRFDDAKGYFWVGAATTPIEMKIVQRHSAVNDLVAIRHHPALASSVNEVLRFRGWKKDQPLHFLYFEEWTMYSGTCTLKP